MPHTFTAPTAVRFTGTMKSLQAHFERSEDIITDPTDLRRYNCRTWHNAKGEIILKILENLFSHKKVITVRVEERRLIIQHRAPRRSVEALILKGMRDAGLNPEEA